MSITHILPYGILERDIWTINSLLMNTNVNKDNRFFLKDVVEFNKQKLAEIDKESIYKYLEISSIDIEVGLITGYKEIRGSELPSRARLVAQKGDVLLSTIRPERGAVAIIPEELDDCVVTNGFAVMRSRKISPEVLYFLFRSQKIRDELGHLVKGTTTPMVTLNDLKEYMLPIGLVEEIDKKYTRELYSKWIEANRSSEPLQETVERVFSEYLRSDSNQVNINNDKVNYTVLQYNHLDDRLDVDYYMHRASTSIEWTVPARTLGDVVSKFVLGVSVSPEEYAEDSREGVPYIRIKDIDDNMVNVNIDEFAYLADSQRHKYANFLVSANDIVLARVGGTLGKSALVQERLGSSIVSQHLVILRCSKIIIPVYLLYFLKTSWAREQLNSRSVGSGQQFIRLEELKEALIPVPDIKLQLVIIEKIKQVRRKNDFSTLKHELNDFLIKVTQGLNF